MDLLSACHVQGCWHGVCFGYQQDSIVSSQVNQELPDLSQFFFDNLAVRSQRPGPSRLLVDALDSLGWVHVGEGTFMGDAGRIFHVCV